MNFGFRNVKCVRKIPLKHVVVTESLLIHHEWKHSRCDAKLRNFKKSPPQKQTYKFPSLWLLTRAYCQNIIGCVFLLCRLFLVLLLPFSLFSCPPFEHSLCSFVWQFWPFLCFFLSSSCLRKQIAVVCLVGSSKWILSQWIFFSTFTPKNVCRYFDLVLEFIEQKQNAWRRWICCILEATVCFLSSPRTLKRSVNQTECSTEQTLWAFSKCWMNQCRVKSGCANKFYI